MIPPDFSSIPTFRHPSCSGSTGKLGMDQKSPDSISDPHRAKPSLLTALSSDGCCGQSNPSLQPLMPRILQHFLVESKEEVAHPCPQELGTPWGGSWARAGHNSSPDFCQGGTPAARISHHLLSCCFKGSYKLVMT